MHLGGAFGGQEPEAAGGRSVLADPKLRGDVRVAATLPGTPLAAASSLAAIAEQGPPGPRAGAQDAAERARVVVWVVVAADGAVGAVGVDLAEHVQRVRAVQQLHDCVEQRRRWRAQLRRLHT